MHARCTGARDCEDVDLASKRKFRKAQKWCRVACPTFTWLLIDIAGSLAVAVAHTIRTLYSICVDAPGPWVKSLLPESPQQQLTAAAAAKTACARGSASGRAEF